MNPKQFHGKPKRLRRPGRMAMLEVDRVVDLTLDALPAKSVLDIGTGSGIFAEAFIKRGLTVSGVDINPEMIEAASDHIPEADFRLAKAGELPFTDGSFDAAFMGLVLHEVDDVVESLREAYRVTKQGTAVLEWPYKPMVGPPKGHRLRREVIMTAAEKAGFKDIQSHELSSLVFFILIK